MVQIDTPAIRLRESSCRCSFFTKRWLPPPIFAKKIFARVNFYLAWSIWSLLHGARSETGLNVERRALSLSYIEFLAKSQGPTDHKTDEQTNSSGWKFQASLLWICDYRRCKPQSFFSMIHIISLSALIQTTFGTGVFLCEGKSHQK